jgi:arylformamidase
VVWTYQNAIRFGGNPDNIYISGHSSGAHLAGVLITTDWVKYGLPADVVKGAVLCSGMYDLYPVSLSSRNEYVEFTDKMVRDLSPINHIDKIRTPVILAYGTHESPEFKRQSQAFAEALKKESKQVELHILEGYNHFEIMIAMGNPYDISGELMIKQMKID